jgi:hypothetical protein
MLGTNVCLYLSQVHDIANSTGSLSDILAQKTATQSQFFSGLWSNQSGLITMPDCSSSYSNPSGSLADPPSTLKVKNKGRWKNSLLSCHSFYMSAAFLFTVRYRPDTMKPWWFHILHALTLYHDTAVICRQETHLCPSHSLNFYGCLAHNCDHLNGDTSSKDMTESRAASSLLQSTSKLHYKSLFVPTLLYTVCNIYHICDQKLHYLLSSWLGLILQFTPLFILLGDFGTHSIIVPSRISLCWWQRHSSF